MFERLSPRAGCKLTEESMASAMRKMAVYLGLVEDDRYDDYDEYDVYDDDAPDNGAGRRRQGTEDGSASQLVRAEDAPERDHSSPSTERRSVLTYESGAADLARITTLHPRTYNEARTIGE